MRVVIGTAGHVDHGKTALVLALTGIDTDRLPEEKRRGITTELGFAHLELPELGFAHLELPALGSGPAVAPQRATDGASPGGRRPAGLSPVAGGGPGATHSLIDVPGHEKFLRAMASGAGGIDVALLVVAVDEGVMPQTREHVDICALLGMRAGVVALTKCDLAPTLPDFEESWLPLVEADLDEVTKGTFLERAPRVRVSARTGEGLDELKAKLAEAARAAGERAADGPLFLPIDRAFAVKGFGTVVTGTLVSGKVDVGDEVDLVGSGADLRGVRVRGVQVHGAAVPGALAGQRTALNLAGVEASAVPRGAAAVPAGSRGAASMLDVELTLLRAAPRALGRRSRLDIHLGAGVSPAIVALVDRDTLEPGDTAFAQLRLGTPLAAIAGARFIVRGGAAIAGRGRTLGGGVVLRVATRRLRGRRPEVASALAQLKDGDASARALQHLADAGEAGLTPRELLARGSLSVKSAEAALEALSQSRAAMLFDKDRRAYVAAAALGGLVLRAAAAVEAHAAAAPLAPGLPREELHSRLGAALPEKLFARVLMELGARGFEIGGDVVRRVGHAPSLGDADGALKEATLALYREAALAPPTDKEAAARLGADPARVAAVLRVLGDERRVVRVADGLFFEAGALATLEARLVEALRAHGGLTTQEFKDLVGQSRKFVIPLSEHFDRARVTLRVGDRRVLRGRAGGAL